MGGNWIEKSHSRPFLLMICAQLVLNKPRNHETYSKLVKGDFFTIGLLVKRSSGLSE